MITSIIKNKSAKKVIQSLIAAVIWIVIWQLAYMAVNKELLIVSPLTVVKRLGFLITQLYFWKAVLFSIFRIMAGYAYAVVLGVLLAVATSALPFADILFQPVIKIISASPISSFIILALVWFRSGDVPVFISFLMVLPLIWANVAKGISCIDIKLLEMADCFKVGFIKRLKGIYIPEVMPYFLPALTTGIGIAWKSGIAAEVLGLPRDSIGINLYSAKVYLETQDLFAWTAAVIIISVILEKFLVKIIDRMKL